ncbi:MAG: biotin-dependent carboxyltransferase family protein [Pseudomonadota bacterium]
MTIVIEKPGLQTTVQASPFSGHRHIGMPAAGAADSLCFALANRLVGKSASAAALEITLDDVVFTVRQARTVSVTGAADFVRVNDAPASLHQSLNLEAGDRVHIGPAGRGCRTYVAFAGNPDWDSVLGSWSTCLQAGIGGFQGRALQAGDRLRISSEERPAKPLQTPDHLKPNISGNYLLRITIGPEFGDLAEDAQKGLCAETWQVGRRSSRMGLTLQGTPLGLHNHGSMPSAAVFPGTIQCPPDGTPFLLGPDAQTTGGYPRIAQVIRADRHLIGQLRPNDRVQLLQTSPDKAQQIYRQKLTLLRPWLGEVSLW